MASKVVAVHHMALTAFENDARARTQQIASRRERRGRGVARVAAARDEGALIVARTRPDESADLTRKSSFEISCAVTKR